MDYGFLPLERQKPLKGSGGGRPDESYLLNESQFTLLVMLVKNTPESIEIKQKIIWNRKMTNKTFTLENEATVTHVMKFLLNLDFSQKWEVVIRPFKEKRSPSQNTTFHMWVGEISDFLIKKGRTDWTPEFTKDWLKHTFLGYEDVRRVDISTGEAQVCSQLRHTSDLKTGEMYFFMQQVEEWAVSKNCMVTIPVHCEYRELQQKENS